MADLKVLISSRSATAALKALATVESDLIYLDIPNVDSAAALTILNGISEDDWWASGSTIEMAGEETDGIKLPKKAIDG